MLSESVTRSDAHGRTSVSIDRLTALIPVITLPHTACSASSIQAQVRGLEAELEGRLARRGPAALPGHIKAPIQRRLTADQVAELVAEYQAGADMKELAVRWQVHRTTVAGHLRRAGVELRRQGLSEDQLGEAVRLYGEGRSLQWLAERYGCDAETVRTCLKREGVARREPWERR